MRLLSWNVLGGNSVDLATALTAHKIDMCVLQEAKVNAADPWYVPLNTLKGYTVRPLIPENETRKLPGGATLYPAESQIRAYAIVTRDATIPVASKMTLTLVNYVKDAVWGPKCPSDPFEAAAKGYNQRTPLAIDLSFAGSPTTVFTWHAPEGPWNTTGMKMFDGSGALDNAKTHRTVIAGDLNVESVAAYFSGFAGVQQKNSKIDYVLGNTTLNDVTEIPGIDLQGGNHWAVAAEVVW